MKTETYKNPFRNSLRNPKKQSPGEKLKFLEREFERIAALLQKRC